jgi:hypothetical protein
MCRVGEDVKDHKVRSIELTNVDVRGTGVNVKCKVKILDSKAAAIWQRKAHGKIKQEKLLSTNILDTPRIAKR